MATTLWQVKVDSIEGPRLRGTIERMHEDAGPLPGDEVFALRVLYEQATGFDASFELGPLGPLGEAVSEDEIHDDDWMKAHAGEYVEAVEVASPAQGADEVGAVADYAVSVTSPRWLEHLEPGQSWRSAAYS